MIMVTLGPDDKEIPKYFAEAVSELLEHASAWIEVDGSIMIRFDTPQDELAATIKYGDIYTVVRNRMLENIIEDIHAGMFK
jgi:hypothetical protein